MPPFISEFLFRYTLGDDFVYGQVRLTVSGVVLAILFSILLAFVLPAILPGARAWHKGYNLYNGGLAFGIFGFLYLISCTGPWESSLPRL